MKKLGRLISAYRAARGERKLRSLARRIRVYSAGDEQTGAESNNGGGSGALPESAPLDRTIVVKAPLANGEKGVLLVYPENNWEKLLSDRAAVEYLDKNYHVILSAGWSPTDYQTIFRLLKLFRGTLFVQASNRLEFPKLEGFHERIRCLPTLACDWIDPGLYEVVPRDRRNIDIVMVANWAPFKRHWELFRALVRLPAELQVTLIGQPDGAHTVDRVRQQAKDFGVPQQIQFLDRLKVEEVQDYICHSKISLMLSRHEGHSVVTVESMFADTPIGLLRQAYIGPKEYINPQTGVLLAPRQLAAQIAEFLKNHERFQPRQWACSNIAAPLTLIRLNNFFREHSKLNGLPWTADIVPFCWRPFPQYVHHEDRMRLGGSFDELRHRFPKLFGAA